MKLRRTMSFILAGAMALSLAACSGAEESSEATTNIEASSEENAVKYVFSDNRIVLLYFCLMKM